MTEYLKKSFTVGMPTGQKYRDNWDAIFGKVCRGTFRLSDGTAEHKCMQSGEHTLHGEEPEAAGWMEWTDPGGGEGEGAYRVNGGAWRSMPDGSSGQGR